MIMHIFPKTQIPTVTAQEKGETIKYTFKNGRSVPYISHYEKPAVQDARDWWKANILETMRTMPTPRPYEGPVKLSIDFCFMAKKKKDFGKPKETKPDLDNTVKLVQDVLADLGFFSVGDQQIADLHVRKFWDEIPHILIDIEEVRF